MLTAHDDVIFMMMMSCFFLTSVAKTVSTSDDLAGPLAIILRCTIKGPVNAATWVVAEVADTNNVDNL